MADILDQSAVDVLISATGARTDESSERREVRAYDFKKPQRVNKEQMRTLEDVHKSFARNFGASLCDLLHTIVEVRMASIEQLTYSEFVNSLPSPTCFNLFKATPFNSQLCLEISPLIVYPIIDRLLGGSNVDLFVPQRPLTAIEWRLIRRVTDRAAGDLNEAWSNLGEVCFELAETESNPHLLPIVAPNEMVVVIAIELKIGMRTGTMSLCLPFEVIEPFVVKRAAQSLSAYQGKAATGDRGEQIAASLKSADVGIRVFLAETIITVNDLLQLQPGDIIQTSKPCNAELLLKVEDRSKFAGKLYKYKGLRAIRITRRTEQDETL